MKSALQCSKSCQWLGSDDYCYLSNIFERDPLSLDLGRERTRRKFKFNEARENKSFYATDEFEVQRSGCNFKIEFIPVTFHRGFCREKEKAFVSVFRDSVRIFVVCRTNRKFGTLQKFLNGICCQRRLLYNL